ncbi:MAG: hypothetical protein ACLQVK_24765 [Acidimicrobiales bacterium]|jgi:hypothetical protein
MRRLSAACVLLAVTAAVGPALPAGAAQKLVTTKTTLTVNFNGGQLYELHVTVSGRGFTAAKPYAVMVTVTDPVNGPVVGRWNAESYPKGGPTISFDPVGTYEPLNSHPQWRGPVTAGFALGDLSANKVGTQAQFLGQQGFAKSESPMVPL